LLSRWRLPIMTAPTPGLRPDQSGLAEDQAPEWTASARPAESLQDPEAYRAFVKALYAKVEQGMADRLDAETQTELAELARLLTTMPRKVIDEHRTAFETAFDLLGSGNPNILVVRSLRLNLATEEQRHSSLLAKLLLHVCGDTPLTAVLSALASVFVLSFLVVLVPGHAPHWLTGGAPPQADSAPFLFAIKDVPIGQVMLLMHAAFLGSIASVIVRVRDFLKPAEFTPLLLYISVLTKPFVAVTFALLAYAVLKAGLVSFLGVDLDGPQAPYLAWALGFLCGFSERLAQDFVIRASTELGEPNPLRASFSSRQDRD
jgi:hypothetical protein